MSKKHPMTDEQAEMVAHVLRWLWPQSWLRTEQGIWRCVVYTKILFLGSLAVLLLLLAFLVALPAA